MTDIIEIKDKLNRLLFIENERASFPALWEELMDRPYSDLKELLLDESSLKQINSPYSPSSFANNWINAKLFFERDISSLDCLLQAEWEVEYEQKFEALLCLCQQYSAIYAMKELMSPRERGGIIYSGNFREPFFVNFHMHNFLYHRPKDYRRIFNIYECGNLGDEEIGIESLSFAFKVTDKIESIIGTDFYDKLFIKEFTDYANGFNGKSNLMEYLNITGFMPYDSNCMISMKLENLDF